jgi:hypothetical protein
MSIASTMKAVAAQLDNVSEDTAVHGSSSISSDSSGTGTGTAVQLAESGSGASTAMPEESYEMDTSVPEQVCNEHCSVPYYQRISVCSARLLYMICTLRVHSKHNSCRLYSSASQCCDRLVSHSYSIFVSLCCLLIVCYSWSSTSQAMTEQRCWHVPYCTGHWHTTIYYYQW